MKCPRCDGKGFLEYNHGLLRVECECDNGNVRGIEQSDTVIGSGDTSQSSKPKKPKAKRKARARSS